MAINFRVIKHQIIISSICTLGFLIHMISVSEQYLLYEIDTVVETSYAEYKVVIPDLSLCNYLIDMIDEDKLSKTDFKNLLIVNNAIENDTTTCIKDLLRDDEIFKLFEAHFDTSTIMNELIYKPENIFLEINYLKRNSSFIGLDKDQDCKIRTYNQLKDICFSIACPYDTLNKDEYNIMIERNVLLKSTHKNMLLMMILNQTILQKINSPFTIYIFSTNVEYTYGAVTQTPVSILSDVPREYDITYQRYQNIRLPSPYTTNCVNYFEKNYKSKAHKFESCIEKQTRKKLDLSNRTYFGNVIKNETKGIFFDFYRQNLNSNARTKISALLDEIFDICNTKNKKQECYSEVYLPYLIKQRILKNDSDISIIQLLATTLPEVKNEVKPKFTGKNLILFYCSVVSSWYGLTVLRSLFYVYETYLLCKKKFVQLGDEKSAKKLTLPNTKSRLLTLRRNKVRTKFVGSINTEYASSLKELNSKLVYTTASSADLTPSERTSLNFPLTPSRIDN